MVSPAGMSMPGANASTGTQAKALGETPQDAIDLIGAIFQVLGGGGANKGKKVGNQAAQYIKGNGSFSIRPLGEQVKVRDGKQGEADYWSSLGYDA